MDHSSEILSRGKAAIIKMVRFAMKHSVVSSAALLALLLLTAVGPTFNKRPAVGKRIEREKDSAKLIRDRANWFFHQRAYPLGFIPVGTRLKALQQTETMRENEGTFMQRFAASGNSTFRADLVHAAGTVTPNETTWTDIGPEPTASADFGLTSGRINALAVDPCDTTGNTVYVGAALGGVWKTTDALSANPTWTPLTDSQPSLSTGSLAVDPNLGDCTGGHTGRIYYGTGEENFAYDSFYGAGVLVSTDGGTTWTKDNTFATLNSSGVATVVSPQSNYYAGPFIGGLAVDPVSAGANQVVLAAIQGISNQANSGIYRSTDGGLDWTREFPTNSLPQPYDYATSIAFDPNDATGNTAYAALGVPFCTGGQSACGEGAEVDNGVYKSTDNGQTWTRLESLDNEVEAVLGESPANGDYDYGRITIAVGPSSPAGTPADTELVVTIADITTESSDLLGAFISKDGGNTFAPINTSNFCNAQCFYDMSAAINPANAQEIILGGGPSAMGVDGSGNSVSPQCGQFGPDEGISAVIRSIDGGNSFADASCDNASGYFIHVDTHAFAFGPNGEFFIGDDGGIWSSDNLLTNSPSPAAAGEQDWSDLNNSLELTQFYPGISIHPSNPEIGFSGSQDNGTQEFDPAGNGNASNGRDWLDTDACGDGGWTAIDPSTPSTVFAACEAIGQLGTINLNVLDGAAGPNGTNWIAIDTPAMDADINYSTLFVPPLVLDSNNPQNVYFGTYRVWQSTTGGYSWNPISPDLTGASNPNNTNGCYEAQGECVVTTMAVAPTDSNTLYVGTDEGLAYLSTNATTGTSATFTEIDHSSGGGTPQRFITQIAVSPANPQVAFVSYSGFSSCTSPPAPTACDGLGHIYEVTGGGTTWTNITGNLPDTPVNDIVVDPDDATNNTLYIATDVGVFATSNATAGASTTWQVLATGLPHVECTALKLDNTARVLRVGTHGRGDWDLQLSGLPTLALTGIYPTSVESGLTAPFTMTLNGQGFSAPYTVNFGTNSLTPLTESATQITVAVPTSATASAGVVKVSVSGSNALNFSIEGTTPTLSTISPTTATTANPVTLTVTGAGFNSKSEVLWVPNSGTNSGNPMVLTQNAGGSSTSFTVTVPTSVLTYTTAHLIPTGPSNRQGPGGFWLLGALLAVVCGGSLFIALPKRRRLVFGATLATAVLWLVIAGCGNSNSGNNINLPGGGGGGGSGTASVVVLNPAPGGGTSAAQTFTVTQ